MALRILRIICIFFFHKFIKASTSKDFSLQINTNRYTLKISNEMFGVFTIYDLSLYYERID